MLCQYYHVLPRSGGLLDQDSYTIYVLNLVREAVAEREALDAKRAQHKRPPK